MENVRVVQLRFLTVRNKVLVVGQTGRMHEQMTNCDLR